MVNRRLRSQTIFDDSIGPIDSTVFRKRVKAEGEREKVRELGAYQTRTTYVLRGDTSSE